MTYGRHIWLVLLACLVLASCGGSGGYSSDTPDVPDPGPQGYYAGRIASDTDGFGVPAVALVDGSGQVRIVDTVLGRQFIATLPATRTDWTSRVKGYAGPLLPLTGGRATCTGMLHGAGYDAAELFGGFSCGSDHYSFDLVYDDQISFQPPDVVELTGAVEGTLLPSTEVVLMIAPDGSVSGSDTAGCTYSGALAAADDIVDVYDFSLEQLCAGSDLHLAGLAIPGTDPKTGAPALYYGVSDSGHSLAGLLVFQ